MLIVSIFTLLKSCYSKLHLLCLLVNERNSTHDNFTKPISIRQLARNDNDNDKITKNYITNFCDSRELLS